MYNNLNKYIKNIIIKWLNDLLALEVWINVPMRPRCLKSFDSTLQVFRMYLLALMVYTGV